MYYRTEIIKADGSISVNFKNCKEGNFIKDLIDYHDSMIQGTIISFRVQMSESLY